MTVLTSILSSDLISNSRSTINNNFQSLNENAGLLSWTQVTGTSQAAAVNNGYILNNVALVTVTLPSTAAIGDRIYVRGKGVGLWVLAQPAGVTVHFGSVDTTTGTGGSVTATNRYDCLEITCITANIDWVVSSAQGSLTII